MNSTHSFVHWFITECHSRGRYWRDQETNHCPSGDRGVGEQSPQPRRTRETDGGWERPLGSTGKNTRKGKTVSASGPGSEEAGRGGKEGCSEEKVLRRFAEGKHLRGEGSYTRQGTDKTDTQRGEGVRV